MSLRSRLSKAFLGSYLIKAFSYILLSNIITAATGLGIIAIYTRVLPPSEFGRITLLWLFALIISVLIDARLNTAFSIRFYKSSKEENTKNIYSVLIFNLVLGTIVYTFFFLSSPFRQKILGIEVSTTELTIIFLMVLSMIFANFYTNILMISQRNRSYFWVKVFFNAVLLISSIACLLFFKQGYISYFNSYMVSYLITAAIGLKYLAVNYKPKIASLFSFNNLKELLKIGMPLIPNGLLLMLLTWADRYILNLYTELVVVGIYTVGYRFSEIINNFLFGPFGQAISPVLFRKFTESLDEYKKILSNIFKYYWLATIGVSIGYFVMLKEIFILFSGAAYLEGYNIVGITILGIILWGLSNTLSATIIVKEKTGKMFLFTGISTFINILLNFLLIPGYGMYGAAAATLAGYFVQLAIALYYTQKLVYIDYDYNFSFKSVLFSLCFFAAVLFVSYLDINAIIAILIKTILFLCFAFLADKWFGIVNFIKEVLY